MKFVWGNVDNIKFYLFRFLCCHVTRSHKSKMFPRIRLRSIVALLPSARCSIQRRNLTSSHKDDAASSVLCKATKNFWTILESRGTVRVQGPDSVSFLQGLTTNDVSKMGTLYQSSLYYFMEWERASLNQSLTRAAGLSMATTFLNAQGRVIFEAIGKCAVCRILHFMHLKFSLPPIRSVLPAERLAAVGCSSCANSRNSTFARVQTRPDLPAKSHAAYFPLKRG
jgi:hypothetical protein